MIGGVVALRYDEWQSARQTNEAPPMRGKGDPRLARTPGESDPERLYRRKRFVRRFEERLLSLFDEGLLRGITQACIGQEAKSVALREQRHPMTTCSPTTAATGTSSRAQGVARVGSVDGGRLS